MSIHGNRCTSCAGIHSVSTRDCDAMTESRRRAAGRAHVVTCQLSCHKGLLRSRASETDSVSLSPSYPPRQYSLSPTSPKLAPLRLILSDGSILAHSGRKKQQRDKGEVISGGGGKEEQARQEGVRGGGTRADWGGGWWSWQCQREGRRGAG
jgi:hypothetical protein